jgi:membrane fusion protein, multidrug efflux system
MHILFAVPAIAFALLLGGCNRANGNASATAAPPALLIAPEDLVTVRPAALSAGPLITGSIQPDRKADLRAEVSAIVLAVLKENGQAVKKGDLLVRLDDTSIRDSLISAQEAERVAVQAFDQAERQFQRLNTLRASGMASAQQLEDAEIRRNSTQSDLSASKARLVQARQQLQRTEARAPFDGIVSDRKVSAGDTAQVGKELVKVIDPSSLRFEGLVSSDAIQSVKEGQAVSFRVNGYGTQEFTGKVKLVSPTANPTTRQVEVLVAITGDAPARLAGLYAEGRVEATSTVALMVPDSAVMRDGDRAFGWRVKGTALQKVALTLGERDPRRGDHVVRAGLAEGDTLLRHPVATLKDGQAVKNTPSAASASAPQAEPARKQ